MLRSKEDMISDYVKAAPKGVSRKVIDDMYKKYKGDEAKIHEAINAMWNQKESSSDPAASKQGQWESVGTKKSKRREKTKNNAPVLSNGRGPARNGRDSRGRGRGDRRDRDEKNDKFRRGVNPKTSRPQQNNDQNTPNTSNTRNVPLKPAQTKAAVVVPSSSIKQTQKEVNSIPAVAPSTTSSSGNMWSRGPPDFAKMALLQQQEAERQKKLILQQREAERQKKLLAQQKPGDTQGPTPGQAFAGKSSENNDKISDNNSKIEEPKVVIPEKPKAPSWADKVSAKPKPKAPPAPVPAPKPVTEKEPASSKSEAPETEKKAKQVEETKEEAEPKSAIPKPKKAAPTAPETKPVEKEKPAPVEEKAPAPAKRIPRSKAQEKVKPRIEKSKAEKKPVAAVPEVQEPVVPKPIEKGVKLPTNFGGADAVDFSFGSSYRSTAEKKATPNAWGTSSNQSKSNNADSSSANTSGNNKGDMEKKAQKSSNVTLETSQKKFMSDLMQPSNNKEDEDANSSSKLSPASVVQQSLNEGNAVNVADFESKMIAAVDAQQEATPAPAVQAAPAPVQTQKVAAPSKPVEKQAPVVQQQHVPLSKAQTPVSTTSSASVQQQQQPQQASSVPAPQQQQQQTLPGGNQQQAQAAQQQRQFPNQKNGNRAKGARGRVNKPYNTGPRTGVPGQMQQQQPQMQQQPPGGFPLPMEAQVGAYGSGLQYPSSDPNNSFNYPYNQQMTDMYGSSYGYPGSEQGYPVSGSDQYQGQQPQAAQTSNQSQQQQRSSGNSSGPPPGLGGTPIGSGSDQQKHQQLQQKDQQQQPQMPQQPHMMSQQPGSVSGGPSNPSSHQQQQGNQQPYGMSQQPAPGQYGQGGYNAAPPGMNPMQYQGGMPPYFPNYNFYGFPQSYGASGSYAPPSRYTQGFQGPAGMFDQSNMYAGYDAAAQSSTSQPNMGAGSLANEKPATGNSGVVNSNSMSSSHSQQAQQSQAGGPPGYSHLQNQQYGYGGQQYQGQQGNYFMQQPQMGFAPQQGYGAQPSNMGHNQLSHNQNQHQQHGQQTHSQQQQQHPNRQGHNPMQQQPNNNYGGWNPTNSR